MKIPAAQKRDVKLESELESEMESFTSASRDVGEGLHIGGMLGGGLQSLGEASLLAEIDTLGMTRPLDIVEGINKS